MNQKDIEVVVQWRICNSIELFPRSPFSTTSQDCQPSAVRNASLCASVGPPQSPDNSITFSAWIIGAAIRRVD